MINNINPPDSIKPSNYSGVTINITSPTVNANNGQCSCPQPCAPGNVQYSDYYCSQPGGNYVPQNMCCQNPAQQSYPQQYYLNNYNYPMPIQQSDGVNGANTNASYFAPLDGITRNNTEDNTTSQEIIDNLNQMANQKRNLEKNGKEKRVVVLTNEYIQSLENYLNNPNPEIRLIAAEEVLTRFNEDRRRYDDLALNALINKMLQDPEKIIRTAAMSALSSGLASGNDYTSKLLQDIQQNPEADKTDVVEAANILLKQSTQTEIQYVQQPVTAKKTEEQQTNKAVSQVKTNIPMEDRIAALQGGEG